MNKSKSNKNLVISLLVFIIMIVLAWSILNRNSAEKPLSDNTVESMNLVVYLQDKDAAMKSDCGVTYPKNINITKTKAVADASLRYLFEEELVQYGNYQSVIIKDGVAQVTISNDNDPSGLRIAALSSCESRHLFKVLEDTLTQYESITSVELYSPSGKIEF